MASKEKQVKTEEVKKEVSKKTPTQSHTQSKKDSYLTVDVFDMTGKVIGEETLNKDIFAKPVSPSLLAQVLRVLTFNQRSGTAAVKDRSEVKGGGRKPWRQKGTGRARQGSIRSPQWRGGGVIQGPKPKDWRLDISKRQRRSALLGALTLKAQERGIVMVNDLDLKEAKTKLIFTILGKLPQGSQKKVVKTLVLLPEKNDFIYRATKNLPNTWVETVNNLNTLELVTAHKLLLTKKTIVQLNNFFLKKESN